ncbi:MAG TPA: CDP-alcohol phosphatidyltransferase family protein [Solirubrobacteraceae bacterium]|nr:CDP-alcohol phosphatidyltransferase family protein [Solirubrobacteraceae bacterium]
MLSRRREHRSDPEWKHARWSYANGLTAGRTVIAVSLLGLAIYDSSHHLLVLGLAMSWLGDMVDGHVARAYRCETVLGAQVDGLADRLTAMLVVIGSIGVAHGSTLAVAAGLTVWLQFGVLDHALSAQFLRFDRWSPDEFHLDDEDAWRMNWAPLAKIVSNIPVGLLAFGGVATWGALAGAAMLFVVRSSGSLRLLAGLTQRAPEVTPRQDSFATGSTTRARWEAEPHVTIEHNRDEARVPASV